MHHLELIRSSIQQLWYLGTAKKQSEIFQKHAFLSRCATFPVSGWARFSLFQLRRAACFWLLGTFLWLSLTKVPNVSFIGLVSLFGGLPSAPSHWYYGSFINQAYFPSIPEPACTFANMILLWLLILKHTNGSKWVKPLWTKHKHQGSPAGDYLMLALLPSRTFCTSQIPSSHGGQGSVSTPHRRCVLSQPPAGGGCGAAWGGGSGSGGTCDLAGQQSGVGRPDPSPRRGFPRPPQPTRGRCCMGGSHYPPVGSWCCNLENEQNKQLRASRRRPRWLPISRAREMFLALCYAGAEVCRLPADVKVAYFWRDLFLALFPPSPPPTITR